jgi:A/G-specific adenine glycosylase
MELRGMRDYLGHMSQDEVPWDMETIRDIRICLLAFFDSAKRPLPWREEPEPYRILVSEVMSQQTRLDTVVPYYRKWLERFPDLESLSRATEEEVLALWQGLGYYSRARNLLKAAREAVAEYGGALPRDPEGLQRLPGVGPYTAGAVASIAFGAAVPAVDGNVRRVLSRLTATPEPRPATLRSWAQALVDPQRPGDFNQALMELGSQQCTPRSPACDSCALLAFCSAGAAGTPEEYPRARTPSPVPHLKEAVPILVRFLEDQGPSLWMRRRPDEGLLAGMWEFPGVRVERKKEVRSAALTEATRLVAGAWTLSPPNGAVLDPVTHVFSHLKITYHPVLFLLVREVETETAGEDRERRQGSRHEGSWMSAERVEEHPIPVAQQKLMALALERAAG